MRPPALATPPTEYDQTYFNQLLRVLTQYFTQESNDENLVEQKVDVNEVMQWLS